MNTLLLSLLCKQSLRSNLCNHEPGSEGNQDPTNTSRWKTDEETDSRLEKDSGYMA